MLDLKQLCSGINMPEEITEKVLSISQNFNYQALKIPMDKFEKRDTWMEGLEELRKVFGEDAGGFKMLSCMLTKSLTIYNKYAEKQLSDELFYATFGCFSRFVREHKVSYGVYGFDREWWTPRQIALQEFRIGELEYEMVLEEGQNVISIHIPSDAKLTMEKCKHSLEDAKLFFAEYYPDYSYEKFICDSWLLSPNLKEVLGIDSMILYFQNAFEIVSFAPEDDSYMEWVFKNPKLSIDEVPQDTSLQRKMKSYIKSGRKIGSALGYLKENGF